MKYIGVVFLIVISGVSSAQTKQLDSLNQVIKAGPDTARVSAYVKLAAIQKVFDSSSSLLDNALIIARKNRFHSGEAAALNQYALAWQITSNYPRAVESFLQSYAIYEKIGNVKGMASVSHNLANIYLALSDYNLSLENLKRAEILYRSINEEYRLTYFGMGRAFEGMNKLDSALAYYQRSYEYINTMGKKRPLAFILCHLGNIHAKLGNTQLAITYTQMGVAAIDKIKDSNALASVYFHMAEVFHKANITDSSKYYAELSFRIADLQKNPEMIIESGILLSKLYEGNDKLAYYYYKTAMSVKDSVFSKDQTKQVQNMNFNEKTRQAELETERLLAKKERRNTIQYILIGVSLLTFIIAFLLLSRSIIVNEKLITIIGIMGLLLVFEFINLLIHPYLASVTHHNPLLMLLSMVCVAAFLIPVHHKLEKWIKHRLVEKNKQIRLEAARRTVAKLEGQMLPNKA